MIGRGGMGVVYRGSQASLGRVVALKLLSSELSKDDRFRERFRREATFQAAIEHPNIVPVYETSDSPYGLYIAMRLVPGPNLREVIQAEQLTPARAVSILRGVASALDTAHARGVIHRDVKPANILVVRDHAYLADFGLTKAVGVESITRSGPLLGTLDYVAPEQIRGEEVDSRADVYSLGAVLFECLTGSVPFKRSTDVAVLYAHLEQEPPSVRTLRSELPAAIDEVITRGMAKVPARRQESAGQLIAEAAQALREGPRHTRLRRELEAAGDTTTLPTAPVTTSPGESSTSSWRVRASLAMAALLAVAVGIAVGALLPGTRNALASGRTIKANAASIRVPRNWSELPPGSPIRYLFYHDRATDVHRGVAGAAPPGRTSAGVVIGRVAAFGPGLLPGSFPTHADVRETPRAVRLGQLEALYYPDVRSGRGTRSIELYLVPTSNNVVGVACYVPTGSSGGGVLQDCGQIAATLRLLASRPFSLGARPAFSTHLTQVLVPLAERLPALDHALFVAPTSASQAIAARQVAAAYVRAAKQMTAVPFGAISPAEGGINVLIRDSLFGVSRAFDSLAAAAARRDAAAYRHAATGVRTAVSELGASLDQLTKLGYTVS